jgi:excisionase family DNA binding protein
MSKEIFTLREVALYLKVTERTIYRLVADQRIPAFKVGGSWRFRRGDLDNWIRQQMNGIERHQPDVRAPAASKRAAGGGR